MKKKVLIIILILVEPEEEIEPSLASDIQNVRQINICLHKHFENYDKCKIFNIINQLVLNFNFDNHKKIHEIMTKNKSIKIIKTPSVTVTRKIKWFNDQLKSNVNYFYPPRFLIVEDNVFGRNNLINSLIDILKKQKLDFLLDIAADGIESIQKFKFFLNKGFLYDIIFMDINLPDMLGGEAAQIMRNYENEFSNRRTNIIAVSVEGKKNIMNDDLFDDYCKKLFFNYIS